MDMKILDTVGKRISFILDLKDLRQTELAKGIGVAKNTVSNYLHDNRTPDLSMLCNIADFLNVSADFLLMRTDDYSTTIQRKVGGKKITIVLNDKKLHLTEEQIQKLFTRMDNSGWDLEKALKEENKK